MTSVFEFRDPSWFSDEICELLADHRAAFCIYDLNGELSPKAVTTDFVYIRLHGPGAAYEGSYDRSPLRNWCRDITTWAEEKKKVYCYFDNDQKGYAVHNAMQLREMIEKS